MLINPPVNFETMKGSKFLDPFMVILTVRAD